MSERDEETETKGLNIIIKCERLGLVNCGLTRDEKSGRDKNSLILRSCNERIKELVLNY